MTGQVRPSSPERPSDLSIRRVVHITDIPGSARDGSAGSRQRPQVAAASGAAVPVDRSTRNGPGRLAYGVREGFEVVAAAGPHLVGVLALVSHNLPPARGREPGGVLLAQVVAVRFGVDGQRAHHGGPVGVDVGERGDGRKGARSARAASDRAHNPDGSRPASRRPATRRRAATHADTDVRSPSLPAVSTASPDGTRAARRRRDRHGRGLRGPLLARTVRPNGVEVRVPAARTPGQRFDDLVLDAVEDLEHRWAAELEGVEFAVEDVPAVPHDEGDHGVVADETAGGAVPLGRLLPAGTDAQGAATAARIVIYRRPLEARAVDLADLADLVHDVVVDQVARLLDLDPDEVDPPS